MIKMMIVRKLSTHIRNGLPCMVDVGSKSLTERTATASCRVVFPNAVLEHLAESGSLKGKKGPIVETAIVSGVMAAKKTSDLIPMCHPLALTHCDVQVDRCVEDANVLHVECTVKTTGKTGVEMEALVGASNSALCIYDMCKGLSHDIRITDLQLEAKHGGKSDFERPSQT